MKNGFAFIDLLAALVVAALGVAAIAQLSHSAAISVRRLRPLAVLGPLAPVECQPGRTANTFTCTVETDRSTIIATP